MADMNKIIEDIMLEAKSDADSIIAKAKAEADEIIAKAKSECTAIEKEEEKRKNSELNRLQRRFETSRASQRRIAILNAKQEILNKVVDDAYETVSSLSSAKYDNILLKLFKAHIREGKCIVYFPPSYKPTVEFCDKLRKLADDNNCVYSVSYDRKDVDNGFVMVYGGIEENCTFRSLFEEKHDEIFELAASELFGTEESV